MKISSVLTRVRDRINESAANVYTDAELLRYVNEAQHDLFRKQTQEDESYHNYAFTLLGADSRSYGESVLYDLPTWVHKVTSVSQEENGLPIAVLTLHNRQGSFWAYHGGHRLMVRGTYAGDDLYVECSKQPTLLNSGTVIASPSPSTTSFSSAISGLTYDYELEVNSFGGAIIENTTTTSAREGEIAQVSTSSHDGTNVALTFDRPFPTAPSASDTWEMHLEVQTTNAALVVLIAAYKALMKKSNWEALKALRPDLAEERQRFIESISPRQDQVLPYAGMERDATLSRDQDQDWGW